MFFFLVYTDDPVWVTVGPDRMAKSLKLWHWLTSGAQFMMTIPEKRSLGTSGRWLGINFLAQLGISGGSPLCLPKRYSRPALVLIWSDFKACLSQTIDRLSVFSSTSETSSSCVAAPCMACMHLTPTSWSLVTESPHLTYPQDMCRSSTK